MLPFFHGLTFLSEVEEVSSASSPLFRSSSLGRWAYTEEGWEVRKKGASSSEDVRKMPE